MDWIKRLVKKTPLVRALARTAMRQVAARKAKHLNSADYWESRYRKGRNSGSGSYNRLAKFKADVLNRFVTEHGIRTVIEFGSGDGSQLRLAEYPAYIGVDVSRTAIEGTNKLFADDPSKIFVHIDNLDSAQRADLSLSLDVVYHLIEDAVFDRYMARLFDAADHFVIIYSSNSERPADSAHVRHRRFTDWIEHKRKDFRQVNYIGNVYPEDIGDLDNTSFADFYIFERLSEANQA